jgi:hypothetical protein
LGWTGQADLRLNAYKIRHSPLEPRSGGMRGTHEHLI